MSKLDNNMIALKIIISLVENSNIKWALTGSTSLALYGVDVEPKDIDILTDEKGAKLFDNLLSEYCVMKSVYSETDKIRSFFGKYKINDIDIEVMGDIQIKRADGTWSDIGELDDINIALHQGIKIPQLYLESELKGYENLGREDKVKKIKEQLEK